MSINRVVALLTPLVFAPLAGACAAWLAEHVPGAEISADQLQQIFIAGALVALAPALQWLHGWQKHEARLAAADALERTLPTVSDDEPGLGPGDADDEFDSDDDEFDLEFDLEFDDAAGNGNRVTSGA